MPRRLRNVAQQIWYVCQPDPIGFFKLCFRPVRLWRRRVPLAYLETCSGCGVVITRPYQGPADDLCAACIAQGDTIEAL